MTSLSTASQSILDRLRTLRATDVPAHGGRVLSYVYDSGEHELDALATEAFALVQPVNGLDPTAFPSVAVMERELIGFVRAQFHGDRSVQGTVTSGGTESCLLAVKTARDLWVARQRTSSPQPHASRQNKAAPIAARTPTPRMVLPVTAHAAFQKAAHYFGVTLDLVPTRADGSVRAADIIARLGPDVALVVVSAPSYPTAQLDPIEAVARAAQQQGISCHVDACIGGLVLPWWPDLARWDFRVPGVTSVSADLHKFGYAPKGVSVLLQRGRRRHRAQYFATTRWPGYPVVNPTMLGSKSAGALAAGWAITQRLGSAGYAKLTEQCVRATTGLTEAIGHIHGLRVLGTPTGPLFAVVADETVPAAERVDPHLFADRVREHGFQLQHQPALALGEGQGIPHSTHFTVTPVTEAVLSGLITAMVAAADEVRGKPRPSMRLALAGLSAMGLMRPEAELSPGRAWRLLRTMGVGGASGLPGAMAPLMVLIEALPPRVAETLLIEVIARGSQPTRTGNHVPPSTPERPTGSLI